MRTNLSNNIQGGDFLKKLISFILIAAVLCIGAVPASAEEILPNNLVASPYYQNISSAASLLTITSTTAKCESTVTGRTNTKSITISQTLQIHWFATWFLTVNNATWEKHTTVPMLHSLTKKADLQAVHIV